MKINRIICKTDDGSQVYMGYPADYMPPGELRRDTVDVKARAATVKQKVYRTHKEHLCGWDLDAIAGCYKRSCFQKS